MRIVLIEDDVQEDVLRVENIQDVVKLYGKTFSTEIIASQIFTECSDGHSWSGWYQFVSEKVVYVGGLYTTRSTAMQLRRCTGCNFEERTQIPGAVL